MTGRNIESRKMHEWQLRAVAKLSSVGFLRTADIVVDRSE